MRILLPPSETKREGGEGAPLDLTALSFPALTPERRTALRSLAALSRNLTTMSSALCLGPTQRHELIRNRQVRRSATMPAIERYTGVLYDAIGVDSLDDAARRFAARTVVTHSALFGLVGADDPIPAYRVSHDSRLPGVRLGELWREAIGLALSGVDELVLDLRSEAYSALGPVRSDDSRRFVLRVVAVGPEGTTTALSHFNKAAKGEFTRAVVTAGIDHADAASLLHWAAGAGIRLSRVSDHVLELVVDERRAVLR